MAKSCITLDFSPDVSEKEGAVQLDGVPERKESVDKTAQGEKTNVDSMSRSELSIFIAVQAEVPSQSSSRIVNLRTGLPVNKFLENGVDRRRNEGV